MNNVKAYDEYKEVELPWLLKLPKHWEIIRAKLLFDVIDKRSERTRRIAIVLLVTEL